MRVIAGTHGGRRLAAPKGNDTRPTSDRVREAVFSILGDIGGARVLDLYAGSGALGIEALSRGAASVRFVDSDARAIAAIHANLTALSLTADVERRDVIAAVHNASARGDAYDLVFADPPYRQAATLGDALAAALGPVLASGARIVTESDRRTPLDLHRPPTDERRYGDTLIRIHDA